METILHFSCPEKRRGKSHLQIAEDIKKPQPFFFFFSHQRTTHLLTSDEEIQKPLLTIITTIRIAGSTRVHRWRTWRPLVLNHRQPEKKSQITLHLRATISNQRGFRPLHIYFIIVGRGDAGELRDRVDRPASQNCLHRLLT